MAENEAKDRAKNNNKEPCVAILTAIVFLAAGIGVLVLARHVVKIKGDAVLVALLVIPIFVYLAVMDKLKGFAIGPLSASFIENKFEDVKKHVKENVAEIGEYEEERSTYLGKLSQILNKKDRFCLIYADIDDLRQHSREIFLKNKEDAEDERVSIEDREPESKIRKKIIKKLDFALAYAFCEKRIKDAKGQYAKYDIFNLTEPDVVMIAREVNLKQARPVAERAQQLFGDYTRQKDREEYRATIAIVSRTEKKDAPARDLDEMALARLSAGKREGRGEIHDRISLQAL